MCLKLVPNSLCDPGCLSFPSAGLKGVNHHTQFEQSFFRRCECALALGAELGTPSASGNLIVSGISRHGFSFAQLLRP